MLGNLVGGVMVAVVVVVVVAAGIECFVMIQFVAVG